MAKRIQALGWVALAAALAMSEPAPAFDNRPAAGPPPAWESAQVAVKLTQDDIRAHGVLAVVDYLGDLEAALADADGAFEVMRGDGKVEYVLTDGLPETMLAASADAKKEGPGGSKPAVKVVTIDNPYPEAALLLAAYYDEVGHPEETLRVLDRGLALDSFKGLRLGPHRPALLAERGAALIALKRFADALADYDEGLATVDLQPPMHAKLLRGRGFALTQLGRLDEAEKAYRDSLAVAPGDPVASSELADIARLRAGGPQTSNHLTPSAVPQPR